MWPILYKGTERSVREGDIVELRRLLALVEDARISAPGFEVKASELCLAVQSCGVFERPGHRVHHLELIFGKIQDLDALLGETPPGGEP